MKHTPNRVTPGVCMKNTSNGVTPLGVSIKHTPNRVTPPGVSMRHMPNRVTPPAVSMKLTSPEGLWG